MDFTYYIAAFLALIIGFIASIMFVAAKGHSKRRLLSFALAGSLAVNFSMLINWAHVGEVSAGLLLLDFAFIILFSFAGCALGTLPVLAVRKVWRQHSGRAS